MVESGSMSLHGVKNFEMCNVPTIIHINTTAITAQSKTTHIILCVQIEFLCIY